jgi:glycosyltransferase involved in cell wall biosynthesis
MLVSFVIPVYNQEKYIKRNLESLVKQTNKNFEIVFVDDGSTDNSVEVINNFLKDKDIKYKIISQENKGVSSARNKGLEESEGDYIIFLDSDDFVSENLVEEIFTAVISRKLDIVVWKYLRLNENGLGKVKKQRPFHGLKDNNIYLGLEVLHKILIDKSFWICTGNAAYSKEFLRKYNLKYSEKYKYGEDHKFIFESLIVADKVLFLDKVLFYYLIHEKSAMNQKFQIKQLDPFFAMEEVAKFLDKTFDNMVSNFDESYMNMMKGYILLYGSKKMIYRIVRNYYFMKPRSYDKLKQLVYEIYNVDFEEIIMKIKNIDRKVKRKEFMTNFLLDLFIFSPYLFMQAGVLFFKFFKNLR